MIFTIADLEQLSGVAAHTIRIWERRYQALNPGRSVGNTRFYHEDQLRRLLNIISLTQSGLKISKVCSLSANEIDLLLEKELASTQSKQPHYEYYISQMLVFGLNYNEIKFNELINKCLLTYGIKESYISVMYPILQRLGLMWRRDSICPAQEHFLSNLIRQKIIAATHHIPLKLNTKATWLLYLQEDEHHDIGLLFANYILRQNGYNVIYLGERVPLSSVKVVMRDCKIDHILLFMVRLRPVAQANKYLTELNKNFTQTKINVAGNTHLLSKLTLNNNINWFKSINELELTLKNLKHVN